ncbi:MAG: DNA methylase, partial [Bacteroidota bacterium]|nr:DNA methylase [Bacteroidota bacterium]
AAIKAKSIKSLVELTLSATSNEQIKFSMGNVAKPVAEAVKEITGLNVDGYECIIDNFAIKHTILQHGNAAKEEKRGQVVVTLEYFEKIPMVIKNPDRITDGGTTKIGRRVIVYEKRVNGVIMYVEEIRTKQKELAMLTMYLKKAH